MIKLPKEWMIKKISLKIDETETFPFKFEEFEEESSIFLYDQEANREDNYHK